VRTAAGFAAAFLLFAVLATANAGGYRYGVSDQAYYGVAVLARANPALFPKDTPLLDAQSRWMLVDNVLGWMMRTFGVSLPPLYFGLYLLSLVALFAAAIAFGRSLGLSWWAIAGLVLLLTLRHRITKTGANTLEGYAHARMLAFAFGVAAMTCVVRMKIGWAGAWLALSAVLHSTTAVWFGLAMALGVLATRPAWRRAMLIAAVPATAVVAWIVLRGPLAGHLAVMDEAWLAVLQSRDYLFPSGWPMYAWLANLSYPIVIFFVFRARRSESTDDERAVVAGMFGLLIVFLLSVPFSASHVALAVQLQVNRVFWLMDFGATVYVAWWLMDRATVRWSAAFRIACLVLIAALSVARGVYVLAIESDRRLVAVSLQASPWTETMDWLARQPEPWHVLVDPAHPWKYGVSVRLAGEKDILLDITKDPAVATYDPAIARRVAERTAALADFDRFTAADVRALATRYNLDVLVVDADRTFEFPVLFRNSGFTVYDLR